METDIKNMLLQKTQPANITALMEDVKVQLKYSRGKMRSRYEAWNHNIEVFRGERARDQEDFYAHKNAEPGKQVIGMSYAQVMTFLTFGYMQLTQNNTFFSLSPRGNEDYKLWEISETLLERDLRHSQWKSQLLVQCLLDLARMGIACTKTVWKETFQWVNTGSVPRPMLDVGPFSLNASLPTPSGDQRILAYQGNEVVTCSPFHIIPDMRLPLSRWREGRFFADETEFSLMYLKSLEEDGILAGTEFIERLTQEDWSTSKRSDNCFAMGDLIGKATGDKDNEDFLCVSTEGQFKIVPSKYDIGPEKFPVDYFINIANDNRMVRLERAGYLHGQFVYDLAQFLPDEHAKLNKALSDNIDELQETITFLVNTRLMALRKGLDNHIVADPTMFDTSQLEGRTPVIYTKKGAPSYAIDKCIKQLQFQDNTSQNMAEAEALMKIMNIITGAGENVFGQYAPGRRSATESRAVNSGTQARLMFHVSIFAEQLCSPMGLKMLSNLRQGISPETFTKVLGTESPTPGVTLEQLYAAFKPTDPTALVGNEDFFIWDSTSQNDKGYLAQSLQELVIALASNPEMIAVLGYDITKLVDEIQYLRGVRNVQRFKLPAQPVLPPVGTPPGPGSQPGGPGAGVVPPDQAVPAVA